MHLVGIALGGLVSVQYAAKKPYKVTSLSPIEPDDYGTNTPKIVKPALWPYIGKAYGEFLFRAFFEPILFSRMSKFGPKQDIDELKIELEKHLKIFEFEKSLLSSLLHMPISNTSNDYLQVARHEIPTLLIRGQNDKIKPIKIADQILTDLPREELIKVDSGHLSQFEASELVNETLIEFITRTEHE